MVVTYIFLHKFCRGSILRCPWPQTNKTTGNAKSDVYDQYLSDFVFICTIPKDFSSQLTNSNWTLGKKRELFFFKADVLEIKLQLTFFCFKCATLYAV